MYPHFVSLPGLVVGRGTRDEDPFENAAVAVSGNVVAHQAVYSDRYSNNQSEMDPNRLVTVKFTRFVRDSREDARVAIL